MKKTVSLFLIIFTLFSLCSCSRGYISSYKAVGLVRSNTRHSAEASFASLVGRLVWKLKMTEGSSEGGIGFRAELSEGHIDAYYDIYGLKEKLFSIDAGQTLEDRTGYIEPGKSVYIIIETNGKARGSVSFELNP